MPITNRDIAASTDLSLGQVKRLAVELLGHDPQTGQHSGVQRNYKLDEALVIAVGGVLVQSLGYKLAEANKMILKLISFLSSRELTLERIGRESKPLYFLNVYRSSDEPRMELRRLVAWRSEKLNYLIPTSADLLNEKYKTDWLEGSGKVDTWTPSQTLPLTFYLSHMVEKLDSYND